ncbi:MAG: response regulator transcription factor [Chloroflexi bacterium]|nr:MAG: response regulator transcription factor [Chloroflexota bacterium]TMF54654.1 MAG: response regulator transcription factor [Chloroflexota bacterium]
MNEKRRIRVLIVDDHAVVRSGLRTILETEPDIEIVGEAGDGHAALELAQELLPDVVLMDINMGDWDGVTATRRVRNYVPSARVIVLTNYDEDDLVFSSIRAGASGYLLKEVTATQLTNSIRTVADGFSLIYPSVARRVLDEFGQLRTNAPSGETDVYSDLTPREREVLRLVASGRANKEIGAQLGISERTVKTHISNIFSKLELTDRTQAALFVHNRGLLEKDSAR